MGHATNTEGLTELLAGMGSATPAPLFLVDERGQAVPLNRLAQDLPEDHGLSSAVVSPVGAGASKHGNVIAYVEPGQGDEADLVATLVALTAELVGRGLRDRDDAGAAEGDDAQATAFDTLTASTEARDVAGAVAAAAASVTGARRVVVFVRRDDARLEPLGLAGVSAQDAGEIEPGSGLLGWAASRGRATLVGSAYRFPADAPRDGAAALLSWLTPPFVLLPLASGRQLLGLLCVTGLPQRAGRDAAADAASRLDGLATRAGAALAGALVLRAARREEQVRRELDIAGQIHRRLLPRALPTFAGLEVAGECRTAAQVGGDWFGFEPSGGDALVASLFDVAGHGIGAAFCMSGIL